MKGMLKLAVVVVLAVMATGCATTRFTRDMNMTYGETAKVVSSDGKEVTVVVNALSFWQAASKSVWGAIKAVGDDALKFVGSIAVADFLEDRDMDLFGAVKDDEPAAARKSAARRSGGKQ